MAILEKIEPGLWRWSARHPEWRPNAAPGSAADWPHSVGCVLCDAADATVLIDPLVPPGESRLLGALDEHVSRRDIPVNPNHVAVPEAGVKSVQYASRSRK